MIRYSDERNVQIVVSLLKAHGVSNIVASPGTTNMCFVGSVQNDPFFHVYSCVDERSAAFMACGIAENTGRPVVLSCTGATASRNYYPGLTEAFYKKLPIIAITSHQGSHRIGHLIDQNIDRRQLPRDLVKLSVEAIVVKDKSDEHYCEIEVNKAILESMRHGNGPVHINLFTRYSRIFTVKHLPSVHVIRRYFPFDKLPQIPDGRKAIYIGSHRHFSEQEIACIDAFCGCYDAVVFCDQTSSYKGKYRVQFALPLTQMDADISLRHVSLLIHIGEVSGDTPSLKLSAHQVWRVSPDGEIRDTFGKLTSVFEMEECSFFKAFTTSTDNKTSYLAACKALNENVKRRIGDLPLSNIWVASQFYKDMPAGSKTYLGILNSLRSWNYFELPDSVCASSNVGGFGIDGGLSTMIGSSIIDSQRIHYCFLGDLAFFYDVNILKNNHIGNNVRILVLNNGRGVEMRNSHSPASVLGDEGDRFLAAAGHYHNQSHQVIRQLAENLGFEYMSASTKEEVLHHKERFLLPSASGKPMLLEIFVDYKNEDVAYQMMAHLYSDNKTLLKNMVKKVIKKSVGTRMLEKAKKLMGGGKIRLAEKFYTCDFVNCGQHSGQEYKLAA